MSYVLIVDNDQIIRSVLVDELDQVGIKAREAVNGLDALQKVKEEHPAVIVLDEHMPQMNGQEFLEILQREDWFKDVHIIVFTDLHDVDLMNHKILAGVTDYLNKSTSTPQTVVQAVQKYLPSTPPTLPTPAP